MKVKNLVRTVLVGLASASSAALAVGGGGCNGPDPAPVEYASGLRMLPTCGDIGSKVVLSATFISGSMPARFASFEGSQRIEGVYTKAMTGGGQLELTVPAGAKTGNVRWGDPTVGADMGVFTIPCPADAGPPPDAGDAGTDAATTCKNDGTCEPAEACNCADCTGDTRCGAGCTMVNVTSFPWTNVTGFVDGKIDIDGGNIQHFAKSGQGVGVEMLVQPTLQSQCGGSAPCFQVVTGNFSTFYIQTSGQFGVTQVSPPKGYLKDVVFRRRVNGGGGMIGVDLDAGCFFIQSADLPK